MKKATAVEKRYFPWSLKKFIGELMDALHRLNWNESLVSSTSVIATCKQEIQLGDSLCVLEFSLTASWREIGEGMEVTILVSEDCNSWSAIECKKKCKAMMECLYTPIYPKALSSDGTHVCWLEQQL